MVRYGPNILRGRSNALSARDVSRVHRINKLEGANVPVFKHADERWGWKKEMLLLDSVTRHGLYNWERIAKVLSFQDIEYEPKEVQQHFFRYFKDGSLGKVWEFQVGLEEDFYDHTTDQEFDHFERNKYFPEVSPSLLKSIGFMPHREDFNTYPTCDTEEMLGELEFIEKEEDKRRRDRIRLNDRTSPLGKVLTRGQLAVVDAYRRLIFRREETYDILKEFRLIEQYFLNGQSILSRLEQEPEDPDFLDKDLFFLIKYVKYFRTLKAFYKFYHNIMKERLIKMEITRLMKMLEDQNYEKREPYMVKLMENTVPIFLNAGLLCRRKHHSLPGRYRRRKNKLKFTWRKQQAR